MYQLDIRTRIYYTSQQSFLKHLPKNTCPGLPSHHLRLPGWTADSLKQNTMYILKHNHAV